MSPPEITVEDLLLVVALAAFASMMLATLIRRQWHHTPFSLITAKKSDRFRNSFQTVLLISSTTFIVCGLWMVFAKEEVTEALHNTLLTTYLLPFKGMFLASAAVALIGWLIARHINQIISTEERLQVSEERFRKIFDHSPMGIATIAPDGRFISVNRSFSSMVGYETIELSGRHFTEITHPEDHDKSLDEIHLLLEKNVRPITLEERYIRKNGDIIWTSVVVTVIHDALGRPSFLLALAQDITHRRQTEAALRQSELKFRLLVEESLVGVYIVQDGKFVYANPRLAAITGYTADELIKLPTVLDVVDEADRALVTEQVRRRITGEIQSARYQFRGRRKDGSRIKVEALGTRADFNSHPALLGTVLDITQQKDAEEALLATVENTPNVCVQWYDSDGRILFWNHASETVFGWTSAEVSGKTPDQFILTAEDFSLFIDALKHIGLTGQAEGPAEFEFRRKSGETGWCLSTIFSIPSGLEKQRFVCMDIDITNQKRAESALRELSGRLLSLQDEERRRIARELHDTTAQALAALTMNLTLLRRADLSHVENIHKLIDESLHLAERSVQEIRTLSYLLHPPELDMVGLPAALREYAAGFARRSEIETVVHISPDIRRLPPTHELAIFRIVQEGLGNILRHSQSNTAKITLKTRQDQVVLEIRDWGKGIPPPILQGIEQMRGEIGVGFAGMRERLRLLKGTLKVTSNSAGTLVQATIPLTNPEPPNHESITHLDRR